MGPCTDGPDAGRRDVLGGFAGAHQHDERLGRVGRLVPRLQCEAGERQHRLRRSTNPIIAVKINQNPANQANNNYYTDNGVEGDANAITANPHLILSLVSSLVAAGVLETNIYVSDPTSLNHQWGGNRTIGDSIYTYVHPLHPGVHFVDGVGMNGREQATWPTAAQIVYNTNNTGTTATLGTKIADVFTNAGFIINMAIMKSHDDGPTGCFKNHYGAISGQRHGPIYGSGTPTYYANTIEPMGHQELGREGDALH